MRDLIPRDTFEWGLFTIAVLFIAAEWGLLFHETDSALLACVGVGGAVLAFFLFIWATGRK